MAQKRCVFVLVRPIILLIGLVLTGCFLLGLQEPDIPPTPGYTTTVIIDELSDLYGVGGYPAAGPDWQDITGLEVRRSEEFIEIVMTCNDDYPATPVDTTHYVLIDINPPPYSFQCDAVARYYGESYDYGVFIPSPEFGEPPVFIEDLRLQGFGAYETEGVEYWVEGPEVTMRIELSHIGNPEGTLGLLAGVRRGIMAQPTEDRIPNSGLADVRAMGDALPGSLRLLDPVADGFYAETGEPASVAPHLDIVGIEIAAGAEQVVLTMEVLGAIPRPEDNKGKLDMRYFFVIDVDGDHNAWGVPFWPYLGDGWDYWALISYWPDEPQCFLDDISGWEWRMVNSALEHTVEGRTLTITVPLEDLGNPTGISWFAFTRTDVPYYIVDGTELVRTR